MSQFWILAAIALPPDIVREIPVGPTPAYLAVYNDYNYGTYQVDDKEVYISKNVALIPGDYTVGITAEYGYILEHPEIFYDVWKVC